MRINEQIKLVGEQVVLVPYGRHHVVKYHSWMNDGELRRLTASERLTLDEEYSMQQSWRNDDDKCTFIVLSKESMDRYQDEVKSMIGDANGFIQDGLVEMEIMIAEAEWRGRGIGREAIQMMIKYIHEHLHLDNFQVKIVEDNVASFALFEKVGFVRQSYSQVFRLHTLTLDCLRLQQIVKNQKYSIEPYLYISKPSID